MTSLLPEEKEKCNVTRLKKKSQSPGVAAKSSTGLSGDESRSFLAFSRENLSISNSDLEQGFNKSTTSSSRLTRCWCLCSRQTLLSCAALLLALSCAGLEVWNLKLVMANAEQIDAVKKEIDTLKHRVLERDLLEELKAFEEQLYGESDSDEDSDLSSSPTDYESSYDDTSTVSSGDKTSPKSTTSDTTTTPCTTSKDLEDALAILRRAEHEHGREFAHEHERLLEKEREKRLKIHHNRRKKSLIYATRN